MKLHEWWRHNYKQNRDLNHLSAEELSERLHDTINNLRLRTETGKLGLSAVNEPHGETWMALFTEVLEECNLRGYSYPGPINISSFKESFDHAFDPIPDISQVIQDYGLSSKPYLLKFGDKRWLTQALNFGRFRIASASYYDSDQHNHARRDTELERFFKLNSSAKSSRDEVTEWESVKSQTDYFLFSMCSAYTSRLFGDFNSNACLVIFDQETFLERLMCAAKQYIPNWQFEIANLTYYDPIRVEPSNIIIPKYKPFRHAYQGEVRLICTPPKPIRKLEPINIEIGPLKDCAILVDLLSHPMEALPHDPAEDPIQFFGKLNLEEAMVHSLPEVESILGISLDKSAQSHEDWFFQLQYTDKDGLWQELKMPMLDGLYLLNMLRAAEKEQHLGLWNRE